MALTAHYLVDKSALARFRLPTVAERLGPIIAEGLAASCAIVDLDVLYSARSLADYEEILEERLSLDTVPITPVVMSQALELQHELARRGQHRVSIPDLVISAAAAIAGLTVLHYDSDFVRLASAGGGSQEWVIPQGSV